MAGFTKLCSNIITSSVWSEDDKTRIMWVTMLAVADARGHVDGSVPGMAAIARINLDDARRSIERLESPDPDSRTKDLDGRRIVPEDGGWKIVNYAKYRESRDPEKRKEQTREAVRRHRANAHVSQCKPDVSESNPTKAQAEAEAEAEEKNTPYSPPKGDELFDRFWKAYPRKVAKDAARKAFAKRKVDGALLETMLEAIKLQRGTDQWAKDNGAFIPHPATWLTQGRWADEPQSATGGEEYNFDRVTHEATEEEERELCERMGWPYP